ncbi:hypothetical protein SBRCBS47491_009497 [Sporothrix bragantina]|uniref:Zn(2)-C6 fungal-type domain-containing protein n=1 Tax=Sporothrix bragantina TaxID=671064 RepID=A0ABP0CYD1_9PEZI
MTTVIPVSSSKKRHAVRKQVSRACDWCRTRRVKCDLNRPCNSCQKSGVVCADERAEHPRSLPQALREIERLRERIRHLEAEAADTGEPDPRNISTTLPHVSPPAALHHNSSSPGHPRPNGGWEGISVATARSEQTSYYGPSSVQYFLSRVGTFLGNAFAEQVPTRNMLLTGVNRRLPYLTSSGPAAEPSLPLSIGTPKVPQPMMTRTQEEYFLNTFWESYYYTLPIVDEEALQTHYASLWEAPTLDQRGQRKDSALVDIILALCIQCSSSFLPAPSTGPTATKGDDPTIAGRWYYRRGKALLAPFMESPSVTTVQVQLLAAIYLCCASFQNTAHSTLSIAMRNATVAGLHPIGFYRPFISFYQRGVGSMGFHRYMPATERHAARCVRHAIAFVKIFHKVVKNTTLLAPGWNEYFQWLWNAAVTLAGFLLAHPLHASTNAAREAADCAASVCDIYAAAGFVVAADAATILRCLLVKVDALFAQVAGVPGPATGTADGNVLATGVLTPADTLSASPVGDAAATLDLQDTNMTDSLSWLDPQHPDNPESFSTFMDWALTVDSFNNFDQLLGPVEWDGLKW